MNEQLLKYFFGLSGPTERKAWAIAVKILYHFNCVIITLWLIEKMGYKAHLAIFDFQTLPILFTEYTIVIPIFTFLFVTFTTKRIVDILSALAFQLINVAGPFYMESKSLKELLLEKHILNEQMEPLPNYQLALKMSIKQGRIFQDGKIHFQYYLAVVFTIGFIYRTVIFSHFHTMYFTIVFIAVLIGICTIALATGLITYIEKRIIHAVDILHAAEMPASNSDFIKRKQLNLADLLGWRFPKVRTKDWQKPSTYS